MEILERKGTRMGIPKEKEKEKEKKNLGFTLGGLAEPARSLPRVDM